MLRTSFRLIIAAILLISSQGVFAQMFPPGKLEQIRKPPKYPFPALHTDSLIGREYILVSPTLPISILDEAKKSHQNQETSNLSRIFLEQPSPDTLLAPWIGKSFRILNAQEDTTLKGLISIWYLRAQFSSSFEPILKVQGKDIEEDGYRIVSKAILDSARNRWVGKYLWTNVPSNISKLPSLSRVKVLSIDVEQSITGPFRFHLMTENNDTVSARCKIQAPADTGNSFTFDLGTPFGNLFMDASPDAFWKTVPSPGFQQNGIVFGEDSSNFFRMIDSKGVHVHSYQIIFDEAGHDSEATAELYGKGIWGMPFDTCYAAFDTGKLEGILFEIFDSSSERNLRSDLIARLGSPSVADTVLGKFGMSNMIFESWYYYNAKSPIEQISLLDAGALTKAFGTLSKVLINDHPTIPFPRSMLFYGEEGKENSIHH